MTKSLKCWLIGFGVVVYLAIATAGTLALASVVFCAINKRDPLKYPVFVIVDAWKAYSNDPAQKKQIKTCAAFSASVFFIGFPIGFALGMQKRRPLHGDARWAHTQEIRKAGLHATSGIIVGKHRNRYLIYPGQQFVLLAAPTRSGKGVGVVIPTLLNWADSVVVVDIKGENYELTAGYRKKHGQQVFAFRPFHEQGSTHRYNPLAYVRRDVMLRAGDLHVIAASLYPPHEGGESEGGSSKFWNDKCRDLFLAIGLYLLETPDRPCTLGEVLRVASFNGRPAKEAFNKLIAERDNTPSPLSDECVEAIDRFVSNPDNTLGNILSSFTAPLSMFADPLVDAATSDNDFSLEDVRRKRMSVYVCIPPGKIKVSGLLLNLFFSQLVSLNTRVLPNEDETLKYQTLLVLDEFTAMGRVSILASGVGFIAGYNLRLLTVIQSMTQLSSVYGKDEARTYAQNHALQITFAPKDMADSKELSEWLGKFTTTSHSKGRSRQYTGRSSASASNNESETGRALMLPQELRELGIENEVIMLENVKPILANKIVYYNDKAFQSRMLPSPAVPCINLSLHRAKIRRLVRPATSEDFASGIDLTQLACDQTPLPPIERDASAEEVKAHVTNFFKRFPLETRADASNHASEARAFVGHVDYSANYSLDEIDLTY